MKTLFVAKLDVPKLETIIFAILILIILETKLNSKDIHLKSHETLLGMFLFSGFAFMLSLGKKSLKILPQIYYGLIWCVQIYEASSRPVQI